tara:strand:+ start:184 stop:555 length:372 start_codon:yes stop_codon:yes gene_type:complete
MPNLDNSKFHTQGYTISSTSADASATVVYTCPANFGAITRYLHISNNNTATKKVYVQFYHAEDTTYHYIANGLSMSGHSVINLVNGGYFNLHAGDKIVVYGETANTMEVIVSVEEYYNPQHKA